MTKTEAKTEMKLWTKTLLNVC